jgi:hypothetical protein
MLCRTLSVLWGMLNIHNVSETGSDSVMIFKWERDPTRLGYSGSLDSE